MILRSLQAFQGDGRGFLLARAARIFRRKAHVHVPDGRVFDDELRVLAMMQHHGAATRLLDIELLDHLVIGHDRWASIRSLHGSIWGDAVERG